jgi:hypothetical protein
VEAEMITRIFDPIRYALFEHTLDRGARLRAGPFLLVTLLVVLAWKYLLDVGTIVPQALWLALWGPIQLAIWG